MKSKKWILIIGIPAIPVIALAFLYMLKLFSNKDDRRWLEIRPKHSLAKFSEYQTNMGWEQTFELLGEPTISEGSIIRRLYKIDKHWVVRFFEIEILDYTNNRIFKLEHEEYSTAGSYLRTTGSFTGSRDNRPKHSLSKFSKVKIGMSLAEVVKLAGKPTVSVDSSFIWYRYKIDMGWYMDLHFFNKQLSDMSIVDFPNNRVFELVQDDYITTLPCQSAIARTNDSSAFGMFVDDRDGKAYRTVKIGVLTWMAENLNFVTESSVCYENADSNCTKYGRLYDWYDATNACPAGWRLSSDEDWVNLALTVAGKCNGRVHWKIATTKLQSTEWKSKDGNGTDEIGFSALPGGHRVGSDPCDSFLGDGNSAVWWSARKSDTTRVVYWFMFLGNLSWISDDTRGMHSVRCVRE